MKNVCLFITFLSLILALTSFPAEALQANAQTMTNGVYKIEGGNFNSFSGRAENSQGKKVDFTSGETSDDVYNAAKFKVKSGFNHISGGGSFSLSISSLRLNFGDLNPGEPVTRTNVLTISTGAAPGYQILASENNEVRVSAGAAIPDTTCDDGTCSETNSGLWNSPLTYGFGFRCDNLAGSDCDLAFGDENTFKQFANSSKNEVPVTIMAGEGSQQKPKGKITYKINVSPGQPSGIYQNNILYIAVPQL